MVYGLQPNEDVTGGAWFTDGSLDEGFIQGLGEFVVKHVASKSWAESSGPSSSDSIALTAVKTGDKRKLSGIGEEGKGKGKAEGGAKRHQQSKTKATTVYLPYPPGYTGYPTLQDITTAINLSKIFDVEMGPETTQQLLDVLCFDGRLVKVRNGQAYKSVRKPGNLKLDIKDSSLTEAPCGRCPVFELCEEGGPINAGNCEYFQEWLEIF
jgi:DNA-directed RNA polymerase III subunit RPC6